MTYSSDTKVQAVFFYAVNKSLRKTATQFSVTKSTLQIWISSCKLGSIRTHRSLVSRFRKVHSLMYLTIRDALKKQPFLTLKNLQVLVKRNHSIHLSHETIRRILRILNITRKRANPKVMKSKTYWSVLQEKRRLFMDTYKKIDYKKIISIDETAVHSNLYPQYGYKDKGKRLHVPLRSIRTRKTSLVMALSCEKIEHVSALKDSVNTNSFLSFLHGVLEKLKGRGSYVFLLDNVAFHKSKKVQNKIISCGHTLLYTPPYSPDTNPIENAFSIIKRKIRNDFGKPYSLILLCLQKMQLEPTYLESIFRHAQNTIFSQVSHELYRWIPNE